MESVSLFVTCMVDMFRPEAGRAALRVMERRGAQVNFPADQTCCGQFSYNAGYQHEAALLARHWIEAFESTSDPIVALSGSCAAMVVHIYPDLIKEDILAQGGDEGGATRWQTRAVAVGHRVLELSQWLLHAAYPASSAPMASIGDAPPLIYHLGCHMRRVLHATTAAQTVLARSGVAVHEPEDEDQCCGFGGTYSMTEPMVSTALADTKWKYIHEKAKEASAVALTSADLGCLLHLEGRASRQGDPFPCLYLAEVMDLRDQGHLVAEDLPTGRQS